jgi:hypothetical protein
VITEDLTAFFADFGENAVLAGTAVRVIFDAPFAALPADGAGMAENQPSVLARSVDVPSSASTATADALLVMSEAAALRPGFPTYYHVTEVQPDGTGLTRLVLREAPPPPP